MLTGPWYRWATPGQPESGRGSKPEIQQYAGFDCAREFLVEPQRSLIPRDDEDYYHRILANPPPPSAEHSTAPSRFGSWLRQRTQIRKLYQPIHGYRYLVVIEAHCDVPGFPSVAPHEIAEAGFVVRRLATTVDHELERDARAALQQVTLARQQLRQLERGPRARVLGAAGLVLQRRLDRPLARAHESQLAAWAAGELKLDELAAAGAFQLRTQAWRSDPDDPTRGNWHDLTDATPEHELAGEAVFSLYPLRPDPALTGHTARGRTVFFGMVPTGGQDVERDTSAPRFDEQHLYEIRCFVRRKHDKPGCRGELVWSPPTVGYRIAADADPQGGSRLPVTVSVPSFSDIQAFADRMATGAAGGVRIVQPPDSVLPLTGELGKNLAAGPRTGVGQICFIAFLLLFLIALFLVFLFLPIIVFLFQLFFLLRLKFCIPPAISFDLELAAELKAALEVDLQLDAQFVADIEARFGAELSSGGLKDWADTQLKLLYKDQPLLDLLLQQSLELKIQRLLDLGADFRGSVEPELRRELRFDQTPVPAPGSHALSPPLPFTRSLAYYPRIEVPS